MPNLTNLESQLPDIMQYESRIWEIADHLRAVGIKQSDFPKYMMPFFALVMVEGRMLNTIQTIEKEHDVSPNKEPEVFKELYDSKECGYNEYIVMQGKTLHSICLNDTTFDQDFAEYRKNFDDVLKRLLGINRNRDDQKFLDMDGIVAELEKKKILKTVVSAWSNIDLAPYSNSDITTLEEHIKRKWADISADTAGEQYTPDDIIALVSDIVASKISKPKNQIIHLYDPTCGGANMLFGVADRLQNQAGYKFINTCGSELNDALYALASIEARFRDMATIKLGNTLTKVPFADKKFDVIVANPPYGTKWSGYANEVKHDQLRQFPAGLPATSDGQMLFMQHILWQLEDKGIAVEVHNGSTLFSGDAGSGESNIRKYMFDWDWVEAIIQMPQQEFFNTGIYTYLWIMNKNKAPERKNKVALIDASGLWKLLKKSKGDKRREISEEHRKVIVDTLSAFEPSDICKIYDKEHFYYNKQSLTLTEIDENNKFLEESITLTNIHKVVMHDDSLLELNNLEENKFAILLEKLKGYNYKENLLDIYVSTEEFYRYDVNRETILHFKDGMSEPLGRGMFNFKNSSSKGLKSLKVIIEKELTNDYEIIPHHFNEEENKAEINAFMDKYIFKPYTLKENKVGVEINFNKEFYVPEILVNADDILAEIKELDKELGGIEL